MNNVQRRVLLSVVGLFGVVASAPTAEAAGRCSAGKGGCALGNAASATQARTTAGAKTEAAVETYYPTQPSIAPINSQPFGQTYGRWAAEWWIWALGIPASANPILDQTGQFCEQRQVGAVWFLAGSTSSDPVYRTCKVPAGKSLFFPLVNYVYGAFLNDEPPETRTEAYARQHARCTEPAQITVRIDGNLVQDPKRFFTGPTGSPSPIFNVQLPPGNLFDGCWPESTCAPKQPAIPELVLSPSAEQGYYLFVYPLKPGSHTIRWQASCATVEGGVLNQDITYHLNVVK